MVPAIRVSRQCCSREPKVTSRKPSSKKHRLTQYFSIDRLLACSSRVPNKKWLLPLCHVGFMACFQSLSHVPAQQIEHPQMRWFESCSSPGISCALLLIILNSIFCLTLSPPFCFRVFYRVQNDFSSRINAIIYWLVHADNSWDWFLC